MSQVDSRLSYDDAHVVSGSEDGSICMWDLVCMHLYAVCRMFQCSCVIRSMASCSPGSADTSLLFARSTTIQRKYDTTLNCSWLPFQHFRSQHRMLTASVDGVVKLWSRDLVEVTAALENPIVISAEDS